MKKTIRLNEEQFRSIVKNIIRETLNENQHYPSFLEPLKSNVVSQVNGIFSRGYREGDFFIKINPNPFVKDMWIHLSIKKNRQADINDNKEYVGGYNTEDAKFSKRYRILKNVHIHLEYPLTSDGQYNIKLIDNAIIHEVNHVYDDHTFRCYNLDNKHKIVPLGQQNDKNAENANAVNDGTIPIFIANLSYYSMKTETKAFISTVKQDLAAHGCKYSNKENTTRDTWLYSTLHEAYVKTINFINTSSDESLWALNYDVFFNYNNTDIPYMSPNGFKPELYKTKLQRWAEQIYKDFLTRYDAIVADYLDKTKWDTGRKPIYVKRKTQGEQQYLQECKLLDHCFNLNLQVI